LWEEEWNRQINARKEQIVLNDKSVDQEIRVQIGDEYFTGTSGITTAQQLLDKLNNSNKNSGTPLVALLDGNEVWDLFRPLTKSCKLEVLEFDHPLGKETLWHSSAHVLGQALEYHFQDHSVKLSDGPPIPEGGFFYDLLIQDRDGHTVPITDNDLPAVTDICEAIVKDKQSFARLDVSKQFALELFQGNIFKEQFLSKLDDNSLISLYRCGPLVDLCRGPHVPNTGRLKGVKIHKAFSNVAKAANNVSVQRVYGISFPDKNQLKDWENAKLEAEKRDHRRIGKDQKLFMFHPYSPGSAFFLPHGTRVYNRLMEFIRHMYKSRDYNEVITPLVFDQQLFETSGHWQNYKDDMFIVGGLVPDQSAPIKCSSGDGNPKSDSNSVAAGSPNSNVSGLKPMNCPGHCLIFGSQLHSYRDLPVRLADFSSLHRNENAGSLTGLTRVRRFCQDDAHIFCTVDQMRSEIQNCLQFVMDVYAVFKFPISLKLSTRPDKYMGEISTWNQAEDILREALNASGKEWKLNPGDGAFYGPKVDISVRDAIGRDHQCATIQLDFQLPQRFDLKYKNAEGVETRPVMIHRAILGSIERFMAVLIEHTGGKWPFWLSPRQVMVCPVSEQFLPYAQHVCQELTAMNLYADVGDARTSIAKQVRNAQIMQYNYILVVGQEEVDKGTVSVRVRDSTSHSVTTVSELKTMFADLVLNKKS
jgi:threonyl-tRNA synthetase